LSLLSSKSLKELRQTKNLLAFSAGIDSSALFFLLLEAKIDFDIALVNYHTRESSSKEARHARELARKYGKKCYIKEVLLTPANFEHQARQVRYAFFEEMIQKHHYDHLITAHHLNDRLEWFLMQLTKGAGLVEMLGFEEIEAREGYTLIRPLIHTQKEQLLHYLQQHNLPYFVDESNNNEKYRRNYFRKHFSDPMIKEFHNGIAKSFDYLQKDKRSLFALHVIVKKEAFTLLQSRGDIIYDLRQIDKVLKQMGYILSSAQKEEIAKKRDVVISDRFAVVLHETKIYIAPYLRRVMDKSFKEACRKAKIPAKIRPYLSAIDFCPDNL
jgi:tRNA(Ile)-lysidine synthase